MIFQVSFQAQQLFICVFQLPVNQIVYHQSTEIFTNIYSEVHVTHTHVSVYLCISCRKEAFHLFTYLFNNVVSIKYLLSERINQCLWYAVLGG